MDRKPAGLKQMYGDYLRSPGFVSSYNKLNPLPAWRLLVAGLAFIVIFTAPITIYQLARFFIQAHGRSRGRKAFIAAADRLVPIVVSPIMVNRALLNEPGAVAPGLFVGSFDPAVGTSKDFMMGLVRSLSEIDQGEPKDADERVFAEIMADTAFRPGRRHLLPRSITAGKAVYAFHLQVPRDDLEDGELQPATVCMAEPGDRGQIAIIPWPITAKAMAATQG